MENSMVDLIIPVYKPDGKLDKLMERIQKQTVRPEHIILIHTRAGSGDGFQEDRYKDIPGVIIKHIEKNEFDHGGTRNYGASLSDAEYVMFMTQDAVPEDRYLVENLLKGFTGNSVAAAYARQLPGRQSGIIEAYTRQFNYPEESSVKSLHDLERLGIKTYFCSNVCAVYLKSIYEKMGGFVLKTIFNEDMIMASKIIDSGYGIYYAADARVVHSHRYTCRQQFTRNFDLAVSQQQYKEIFGKVKSETEGIRLVKKTMGYLVKQGKIWLIPELILQSGFKYLGFKAGSHYDRLPIALVKKCSMNKAYWEN